MKNGGKRPGAGRKKGHKASHTIEAEKAREFVIGQVVERLQPIMQSKFALALGHDVMMARELEKDKKTGAYHRTGKWVQVTDPLQIKELLNGSQSGDEYYQIWTKSPDGNSLQYLLNQTIGKPKETVEIGGNKDKPIEANVTIDITKASADELLRFLTAKSNDSKGSRI